MKFEKVPVNNEPLNPGIPYSIKIAMCSFPNRTFSLCSAHQPHHTPTIDLKRTHFTTRPFFFAGLGLLSSTPRFFALAGDASRPLPAAFGTSVKLFGVHGVVIVSPSASGARRRLDTRESVRFGSCPDWDELPEGCEGPTRGVDGPSSSLRLSSASLAASPMSASTRRKPRWMIFLNLVTSLSRASWDV